MRENNPYPQRERGFKKRGEKLSYPQKFGEKKNISPPKRENWPTLKKRVKIPKL